MGSRRTSTTGRFAGAVALLIVCCVCGSRSYADDAREVCRIRVYNAPRGPVQVSCDGGKAYVIVGRVTRPATRTIVGFAAASYTPSGTVAATAIHGIRVKTGQRGIGIGKSAEPLTFSIVPAEFATAPKGFGGHEPGESGVYTDIQAGKTIFREFAPFVGNPVYRLDSAGHLSSIPPDYSPEVGDVLVVIVQRPDKRPTEIVFENRKGGVVTAKYSDGSTERITYVLHPVSGVGRYDGTSHTGVGAINTNHGGVITISTAPISNGKLPEGRGPERRGGFMIQPSNHAKTQGPPEPQVMIVGPKDPDETPMEGRPPLFRGCLSLAYDPNNPSNSFRVQVKIDDGEWENLPALLDKIDDAFESTYLNELFAKKGIERKVKTGVTAIRILFPKFDRDYLLARLKASERKYTVASVQLPSPGKKGVVNGVLSINAALTNLGQVMFVSFYIDGDLKSMTNSRPYAYDWDTTTVTNGEHEIEVRALDAMGGVISKTSSRVMVLNGDNQEKGGT